MPVCQRRNLHLGNIRVTNCRHDPPLIGQLGKQAFRDARNPALYDDDIIGRSRAMARRKAAFNNLGVHGSSR